jgi:hypothetical protein
MEMSMRPLKISLILIIGLMAWNDCIHAQHMNYGETIFVHLDRNCYLSGEIIWVAVYCLETSTLAPSEISRVAYLEILDPRDQVLIRQRISLIEGMGSGSLRIPGNCESGLYTLRCYTAWQRNTGPDAYCYNNLLIIDPSRPLLQEEMLPPQGAYQMEFYPEGGRQVEGVLNRVVFRVRDAAGNPVDYRGTLIGNDSIELGRAGTLQPGIGVFYLVPQGGMAYSMVSDDTTGPVKRFMLPEAAKEGCSLEGSMINDGQFRISLRFKNPSGPYSEEVTATLATDDSIIYRKRLIPDSMVVLDLKAPDLRPGLNHFQLHDMEGNKLAERLFMVHGLNGINIEAEDLDSLYESRDTIAFSLKATTSDGNPTPARISVSICKSDSYRSNTFANSLLARSRTGSQLLEWYGYSADHINRELVDLWMITRSAKERPMVGSPRNPLTFLPEIFGPMLSGKVVKRSDKTPMAGRKVLVSFIDTAVDLRTGTTDTLGRFHISMDQRTGMEEIVIRLQDPEPDALILTEDPYSSDPLPGFDWFTMEEREITSLYDEMLLNQQLNQAYNLNHICKIPGTVKPYPLFGNYDQHIIMDEYIRLPLMEEVFRELGKRVFLVREEGESVVRVLDHRTNRIIGDQPYFFLDGIPFFDSGELLNLDPAQIRDIHFKSSKYFLNDILMDGIIHLRSYEGSGNLMAWQPDVLRMPYHGLSEEQYSLRMDTAAHRNSAYPLAMNTLYFNPRVILSPRGDQEIKLIAPDMEGSYDVVIKGLAEQGGVGELLVRFRIE